MFARWLHGWGRVVSLWCWRVQQWSCLLAGWLGPAWPDSQERTYLLIG